MNLPALKYAAHEDKLTEGTNKVALILAGNTPFYPLYLYFIVGRPGLPAILFAAAALPFFAGTIVIGRKRGIWGRSWLSAVATVNSIYVTWLLGEASGTALFLIPCISLAVLSFYAREFIFMAVFAALPCMLFVLLQGRFPAPPVIFTKDEYHSLMALNEVSVASITMVIGYVLGKAREF